MPAVPDSASAIGEEFPGWAFWVSGTGRWWASRKDALSAADLAAGCVPFLHADGPQALGAQIRGQEAAASSQPAAERASGTP